MEKFFKNTPKNKEYTEIHIEKPKPKEGIDFVFEQNPELAKIGTKEQYSEYLDTIFPGTRVKDIVFHGAAQKEKIENFNFHKSNFANAIFFTKDYNFAKSFAFDDVRDGSIQTQMVNIQNPFDFSQKNHIQELRPVIQQLVTEGYQSENTGITFRNSLPSITIGERVVENPVINDYVDHYMWRLENGSWRIIETDRVIDFISQKYDSILVNEKGVTNIAVFNQDQIHVLGSKTDLDKFTEFVFKNTI